MPGFLYFVASDQKLNESAISNAGLTHAFEGPPNQRRIPGRGPGGSSGHVLTDRFFDSSGAGIHLDQQTWREGPVDEDGNPKFWIGFYTDSPPVPDDLIRSETLDGPTCDLQGRRWKVPRLREYIPGDESLKYKTVVPRLVDYDANGKAVFGRRIKKYQALWDLACETTEIVATGLETTGVASLDDEKLIAMACECLAVNYRVGLCELCVMETISEQDLMNVVIAALDLEGLKKRVGKFINRFAAETTDSSSGVEQLTPEEPTSSPTHQLSAS